MAQTNHMRKYIITGLAIIISFSAFSQPLRMLVSKKTANAAIDTDAQAFITATGISDGTQQLIIDTLVKHFKGTTFAGDTITYANIWSKIKALYPMMGGTTTTTMYNLKDPRDMDAAFRITWSNSPTFSSTGVLFNGSTTYGNTHLVPANVLGQNSTSMGYFSRTDVLETGGEMGIGEAGTNSYSYIYAKYTDGNYYVRCNSAASASGAVAYTTKGLFSITRTGSTGYTFMRNSTVVATPTATSAGPSITFGIEIGRVFTDYTSKECTGAFIADGLTSTEVIQVYNALMQMNRTLNRL